MIVTISLGIKSIVLEQPDSPFLSDFYDRQFFFCAPTVQSRRAELFTDNRNHLGTK